jgi:outer membrane protein insertion porin family
LLKRLGFILLFACFAGAAPAAAQPSPASPSEPTPHSVPHAAADSLAPPPAAQPQPVDSLSAPSVDSLSAPSFEAAPAVVQRVGRIRVVGNTATDSARIVRSFEVLPGSRYTADAVRRGIRKLVGLGLFDDVSVDEEDSGDPAIVDLVISVRERPRIGKITFTGNKKRQSGDLEKKLFLRTGEVFSWSVAQTQVDSLVKYYKDEGYVRATVEAAADSAGPGQVDVRFAIVEGEKVKITDIQFIGLHAFPADKAKKGLKTKRKWLMGGGNLADESFTEDREKLENWYKERGYRDFRVVDVTTKPGKTPKDLTMVITVEEGPRYRVDKVSWTGNTKVSTGRLMAMSDDVTNVVYNRTKIQKAISDAYGEYADHGYLYLNIDPREDVHDSTVSLTMVVTEGQPSHVRYVNIRGNRGTREKVIRRELAIHERDQFRRSALIRTQGDLMRLGFFENVDINFEPAESTDVDITLKVKEKNVGTASAGAGYSGETGLTGFLELGHNNVLGNGQSLQLHLERGSRRSNYYLSFTEPWFRDTPTLLGVSGYASDQEYDFYNEKRVGGSIRLGRPLRWPDYSRGSIGYRLENVTLTRTILNGPLSPTDSIAISGFQFDVPQRSSTVELNFQRVTTDNPFYPTKGTRFTWDNELAGGPFGGAVDFHKHRWEGRVYFPSVLRRVTTMVKTRVGMIDEYQGQRGPIPPYERFRLGGGSTIDPLRGYDDYMVVPEKFIRQVPVYLDTTAGGPDSSRYTTSRYPGGRWFTTFTLEQQFAIAHPLHGVLFLDAGNVWDKLDEYRPLDLRLGAGFGLRLEIPLLGNVGFDYGYGFDRDDHPRWVGHFLIGQALF